MHAPQYLYQTQQEVLHPPPSLRKSLISSPMGEFSRDYTPWLLVYTAGNLVI